jgi:hypothetical protein
MTVYGRFLLGWNAQEKMFFRSKQRQTSRIPACVFRAVHRRHLASSQVILPCSALSNGKQDEAVNVRTNQNRKPMVILYIVTAEALRSMGVTNVDRELLRRRIRHIRRNLFISEVERIRENLALMELAE